MTASAVYGFDGGGRATAPIAAPAKTTSSTVVAAQAGARGRLTAATLTAGPALLLGPARRVEQDRGDQPAQEHPGLRAHGVPGARAEQRPVRRRHLVRGPSVRVVVQREGLAAHSVRAGQRLRVSVVREIRGVEDDAPVEHGKDPLLAGLHIPTPELEVSAVLLLPIAIQVEQEVDPSIEIQAPVVIEIGVDLEEPPARDLVQPTPGEVRVSDEARDAGE